MVRISGFDNLTVRRDAIFVCDNIAVRCGAVRCGAVRCGAVRCGAVRCGVKIPAALVALRLPT